MNVSGLWWLAMGQTFIDAVKAGLKTSDRLRRDPDLDPLRSHPDFLLLVQELEFPPDSFPSPSSPSASTDPGS